MIVGQTAKLLHWMELDLYERVEYSGRVSRLSEAVKKEGSAKRFVEGLLRRGHYSPLEFARVAIINGRGERIYAHVREIRDKAREGRVFWQNIAKLMARTYPAFFIDMIDMDWWSLPPVDDGIVWWVGDRNWYPVHFVTNRAISHQLVRYRNRICWMQESQRFCRYGSGRFGSGLVVIDPAPYFKTGTQARVLWRKTVNTAEKTYLELLKSGVPPQEAREVLPNCVKTELIGYAHIDEWRHIFSQRLTQEADPKIIDLLLPLYQQFVKKDLMKKREFDVIWKKTC